MTSHDQQHRPQAHYDRLAAAYDKNWAYSPAYVAWMTRCIADRARIHPGDRVADIGCGTGLYSRGLADRAGQVACVDPSQRMLAQLPGGPAFVPVQASAEDIASRAVPLPYPRLDAIVIKEAIHHVPAQDRRWVLRGLTDLLTPGGRIVIVMLPKQISYPLFAAALERFTRLQPDPEDIARAVAEAGLQTELGYESFPLSFPKQHYIQMVRDRYMSLLAQFTDAQLEDGIAEIEAHHHGDRLEFPDRFAFVRGIALGDG